jgi:hypothetical protein
MNIEQLRAQHPELYAAAVADGAAGEKKRVTSLLKLGKRFHAEALAEQAIESGVSVADETLQLAFIDQFSNWRDQDNRQQDSDEAAALVKNAKPAASGAGGARDAGDVMADAMGLPPDTGTARSRA